MSSRPVAPRHPGKRTRSGASPPELSSIQREEAVVLPAGGQLGVGPLVADQLVGAERELAVGEAPLELLEPVAGLDAAAEVERQAQSTRRIRSRRRSGSWTGRGGDGRRRCRTGSSGGSRRCGRATAAAAQSPSGPVTVDQPAQRRGEQGAEVVGVEEVVVGGVDDPHRLRVDGEETVQGLAGRLGPGRARRARSLRPRSCGSAGGRSSATCAAEPDRRRGRSSARSRRRTRRGSPRRSRTNALTRPSRRSRRRPGRRDRRGRWRPGRSRARSRRAGRCRGSRGPAAAPRPRCRRRSTTQRVGHALGGEELAAAEELVLDRRRAAIRDQLDRDRATPLPTSARASRPR